MIDTIKNKVVEFQQICQTVIADKNKDQVTVEKFFNYGHNAQKLLCDIGLKDSHKDVLRYIASEFQVQI